MPKKKSSLSQTTSAARKEKLRRRALALSKQQAIDAEQNIEFATRIKTEHDIEIKKGDFTDDVNKFSNQESEVDTGFVSANCYGILDRITTQHAESHNGVKVEICDEIDETSANYGPFVIATDICKDESLQFDGAYNLMNGNSHIHNKTADPQPNTGSLNKADVYTRCQLSNPSSDLKRHTNEPRCREKWLYKCSKCEYSSIWSDHLKKHVISRHRKKTPHKCRYPYCDYSSAQSNHLRNHIMARHTGEKPHKCTHCDYSTTQFNTLKNHIMARHTVETPYKCTHCVYSCKTSSTLKSHFMAQHTGKRPRQCTHCDYSCIPSESMKKHFIARHTNERPYKCTHCDYGCIQSSTLKKHIMARHTKKQKIRTLHKCTQCEYSCSHLHTLENHIRDHHTQRLFEFTDFVSRSFESVISVYQKRQILQKPTTLEPDISHIPANCENSGSRSNHSVKHNKQEHKTEDTECRESASCIDNVEHVKIREVTQETAESKLSLCQPTIEYQQQKSKPQYGEETRVSKQPNAQISKHIGGYKTHQCGNCKLSFPSSSTLRKHHISMHRAKSDDTNTSSTKQNAYKCPQCDYKWTDFIQLMKHIQYNHKKI